MRLKKLLAGVLSLAVAISIVPTGKVMAASTYIISENVFHDANFRAIVKTFDTNNDDQLQPSEASVVTTLNLNGKGITDLTGISAFTNLEALYINNNKLTSLDISFNTNLKILEAAGNNFYYVNIPGTCTDLARVLKNGTVSTNMRNTESIYSMRYASADLRIRVDANCVIESDNVFYYGYFDNSSTFARVNKDYFPDEIFRNYVGEHFDINSDGRLTYDELNTVTEINISGLGVSDLTGIKYFYNLKNLIVINNNLTELDISSNTKLTKLVTYWNMLDSIDISNSPTLVSAFTNNEASLEDRQYYGINAIVPIVTFNNRVDVDRYTTVICGSETFDSDIYSPHKMLKIGTAFTDSGMQYYVSENYDSNHDGYLSYEELSDATTFNPTGINITNYDGLKYLYNLTSIEIVNKPISSIDLSRNVYLTSLVLNGNNLSSLDLSANIHLTKLDVSNNNLSDINIYNITSLSYLDTVGNNINILNITNNPALLACLSSAIIPTAGTVTYNGTSVAYIAHTLGTDNALRYNASTTISAGSVAVPTPTAAPTTAPTVVPTTVPTVAPTTAPSSTPTTAPTATPSTPVEETAEGGVAGFVERLYTIALNRASDPAGKADWVRRVYNEGATGADIAYGFLFSPEFLGKDMTNEEFLGVLYRVFFDRVGDQGGIEYWLGQMDSGMEKQDVIMGFINSTEWANVCLRFGIASGGTGVPNITIEPSDEIIEFATRLYTTCLNRNADQGGLMDWATQLANRQISGSQAAHGFFFSAEITSDTSITDEEYINRLYRTFMGREADPGGFDYWMGQFASGASREDVFNGFAGSQEWAGICSSYGILK